MHSIDRAEQVSNLVNRLGGYLMEANYTGRKDECLCGRSGDCRAGGNNSIDDEVAWIHADPISGSSSRVIKDGTLWHRTEYEPLGNQEISPYGSERDFPEPTNYQDWEAM
ncbi:MAG TPA: hypothetical protein VF604_05630 [Pyrinomonadaceae bacterium]